MDCDESELERIGNQIDTLAIATKKLRVKQVNEGITQNEKLDIDKNVFLIRRLMDKISKCGKNPMKYTKHI